MEALQSIVAECDRAVLTARSGDTRLGLRIASQAYRRAEAEGDEAALLAALNAVAICQSSNGAHINALGTAIDAYRLAVRLGDRKGAAHAGLSLASAAHDVFDSPAPESLMTIHRSVHEALTLGDASLQARAQNILGVSLVRSGELALAFDAFERALALLPATDGTTPAALLLGNIAHLAVRVAEAAPSPERRSQAVADAHRRIDVALARAVADNAIGAELRVHYNRGRLLRVEGRLDEALAGYSRALEIARRIKNRSRIADINIGIGQAFTAMGRHAEAVSAYEAAYAVADDIRPARQLQDACERRALACESAGDAPGAARAREQAARERAFYDRERSHALGELERILKEMELDQWLTP